MRLIIEQDKLRFNYKYNIYISGNLLYTATVNRTIVPKFRKITITDLNGQQVCILKQEDKIKFILSYVPIIGWFDYFSCPYNIYISGIKQGIIKENRWGKNIDSSIECEIHNDKYYIHSHTGEEYSIFLNDKQEGLIAHDHWKIGDGDRYEVLYNSKLKPEFAAAICIFIDILWGTSDTSTTSISYQYTWIIGGRKKDKNWRPED